MWKKIFVILILAVLLNGCRSSNQRDGKIFGDFKVIEHGKGGSSDITQTEGEGTVLLEGTDDPVYRKPIFLKLGKDTPLPDCVIELTLKPVEFDKTSQKYSDTLEYQAKEKTEPHLADKSGSKCRGYFSKDEPSDEVSIPLVWVKSDTGVAPNYIVEINYTAVGNGQKERWFKLLGSRSWF